MSGRQRVWNSPIDYNSSPGSKAVSHLPGEKPPRCRCGGMFPLDRHPAGTGEKICAACYKAETRQGESK